MLKKILPLLGLVVRSLFWTKGWLRWANEKFPDPPQNSASSFSRLHGFIIASLFIVAYGFYNANQVLSFNDVIYNLARSISWASLGNTVVFVILVYIIFAFQLRIRGKKFWRPFGYILLPFTVTTTLVFVTYYYFRSFPLNEADLTGLQVVFWLFVAVSAAASFVGFVYTTYRAVKNRMNAHTTHPVLGPLIELALSAKALVVASQGQALILWLPHVPSRLLVLIPPAAAVVFYTYHTLSVQQISMKRQNISFGAELTRTWKGIANTRRPLKNRLETAWKFRYTQSFRFGMCLFFLILALLLSPNVLQAELFPN